MSWDDIQVELANLSVEDAKALLSFVNQLGVTAAEPAPAPADAPGSGAAGKVPGYTGRETDIAKIKAAADAAKAKPGFDRTAADLIAIKNAAAAGITEAKGNKKLKKKIVAETLTWSKNFDPSRHLIKQIRRT